MSSHSINYPSRTASSAHHPGAVSIRFLATAALFLSSSLCIAQSELARLIPPGTPVLAGMRRTAPGQSDDLLWIATKNNAGDLKQFVFVTAGDSGRRFDQVIVADFASDTDSLGNHLLLAQGRFSFAAIASTTPVGEASSGSYKGVPVLIFESLANQSRGFRWLAVPQSHVALFGSPASVQQALDRYLSNAPGDRAILDRLKNIPQHDAAWSSLTLDSRQVESHLDLHGSGDGIYPCLHHAHEITLGIQPGSSMKIELRTTLNSQNEPGELGQADAGMGCFRNALYTGSIPSLRVTASAGLRPTLVATLAREEYDRWIDAFRKSTMNQLLEASIPASTHTRGGQ